MKNIFLIKEGAKKMVLNRKFNLLLGIIGLSFFISCAKDVGLIDRTDPNKIEKKIFKGEWYFRPIVIETQFNQGLLFEGYEGETDRIHFEIREDYLYAYRSYDYLLGLEDGNGDTDFNGAVVAAFPISSHFDVKRAYNYATGEQRNVLEENTQDRPWYERDYIRVDWSVNHAANPYNLEGLFQAIATGFYEQSHDPTNPHRPEITATHINIVGNYLLQPDYRGACVTLQVNFNGECGNSEAKMLLSFRKVEGRIEANESVYSQKVLTSDDLNVATNYIPLYYPDSIPYLDGNLTNEGYPDRTISERYRTVPVFVRFGFFRHQRIAYDNEYQWTREGRLFLGHRWNIWADSYDNNGGVISPRFREVGRYSLKENGQRGDIEPAIIYYTNVDFPSRDETNGEGIWRASLKLIDEWNQSFRTTALSVKRLDEEDAGLEAQTQESDIPDIFVLRENSCSIKGVQSFVSKNLDLESKLAEHDISGRNGVVRGNLKKACAILEYYSDFTWQKFGDLRYSFLNFVDTPQQSGPLGYGPSAADPLTGEIISANSNVYGAAIDTYAAYAADIVSLMNKENGLTEENVLTGENIREHIQNTRSIVNRQLNIDKLKSAQREFSSVNSKMFKRGVSSFDKLEIMKKSGSRIVPSPLLEALKGSSLEREFLFTDDFKRALLGPGKYQSGSSIDASDLDSNSPVNYLIDSDLEESRKARIEMGKKDILMADIQSFSDSGMLSLANDLKGMSWQEIYDFMHEELYRGVMAHEVGHTLGLRHNFSGSYDALNFHPDFWKSYNPETSKVERIATAGHPNFAEGESTTAERMMYSSIMDYDARFYADSFEGIGAYDRAAIKFGYGGVVEVFDDSVPLFYYDYLLSFYSYEDIPKIFADVGQAVSFEDANNLLEQGVWVYFRDVLKREDHPTSTTAMWKRKDVLFKDILEDESAADRGGVLPTYKVVPYEFCTDDYLAYNNPSCSIYDKGASFREVTQDRMERYDSYYVFSHFRRDRLDLNINSHINRLYQRHFQPMSSLFRFLLFSDVVFDEDSEGNNIGYIDFPLGQDFAVAAYEGINFLTQIIAQPEPGEYCLDEGASDSVDDDMYKIKSPSETCSSGKNTTVPLGTGKYLKTTWSDEEIYKTNRIGTFWDKYVAIFAMTDNTSNFYRGIQASFDSGAYNRSYWSGDFQNQLLDIFSSAFTGLNSQFSWRYDAQRQVFSPSPVFDIYDNTISTDMPRIEPANSWDLRYYLLIFPMIRYSSLLDNTADYINYSRICLEGSRACMSYDEDIGTESYIDPVTSYSYIASKTDKPDRALSARFLKNAQDYIDTVYNPLLETYNNAQEIYDLAKEVDSSDPNLEALLQDRDNAWDDLQDAEHEVRETSGFLEIIRKFSGFVDELQ